MIEEINNLPKIFLGPGEFYLGNKPEVVVTVLGSCIAIIMFSEMKRISAISHSILPDYASYSNEKMKESDFKYVDSTIHKMIQILKKAKVEREEIKVKLFGGAEQINGKSKNVSVGKQNILTAINLLYEEGLQIVSSDVGGNEGRKIFLSTQTGDVYLTRLGILNSDKNG